MTLLANTIDYRAWPYPAWLHLHCGAQLCPDCPHHRARAPYFWALGQAQLYPHRRSGCARADTHRAKGEAQGYERTVSMLVWRGRTTGRCRFNPMPEGWMWDGLGEWLYSIAFGKSCANTLILLSIIWNALGIRMQVQETGLARFARWQRGLGGGNPPFTELQYCIQLLYLRTKWRYYTRFCSRARALLIKSDDLI